MPLLRVPSAGQLPRLGDVVGLGGPVPAAQQQDHLLTSARQVDPVSGADGETQLQDAATDRFRIAEVAGAQTIETAQTALPVLQPTQPTIEVLGGENLEHVSIIVGRGYSGQSSPRGPLRGRSGREGRSCAA